MTKEEIIDGLEIYTVGRLNKDRVHITVEELQKFIDAIKALSAEPCEDCISRQAVIEGINNYIEKAQSTGAKDDFISFEELVVKALPSIQPKPKTGHWIIKEGREQGYDIAGIKTWYIQIMCDKCGFIKTAIEGHTGQYNFCPNCGARMESEG